MKKVLISSSLIIGILASGFVSSTADAASQAYSSTGHSFSKAWEATGEGTNWVMTYGYNTTLINEDYTHTLHNTTSHTAIVKNANGNYSSDGSKGNWAKIEVTHSGSSIQYTINY